MDSIAPDRTHDPAARSWVESANQPEHPFPLQHLPLARVRLEGQVHAVVGIGDEVLNLTLVARQFGLPVAGLEGGSLLGLKDPVARRELRFWLFDELQRSDSALRQSPFWVAEPLFELPFEIGDYSDFYASIHHATRVGSMFRPDNPLLPNYRWVPIGYHGRASSVVVSDTPVSRPSGQLKADDAETPVFGKCKLLDYELELGLWVGQGNPLGQAIPLSQVRQHWIGVSLVNDWSARDIQKWEYQPLGPFLAKSFATSCSPWVTTQEALIPFHCPAAPRDAEEPQPLAYLQDDLDQNWGGLNLELEVWLATSTMAEPERVSSSNSRDLYWTLGQMLAHHASNGCPMRPGDLLASGTLSGPEPESAGCLLELTWAGAGQPRKPVVLSGGQRVFLQDGDTVELRGWARRAGFRSLGLGVCRGRVCPG